MRGRAFWWWAAIATIFVFQVVLLINEGMRIREEEALFGLDQCTSEVMLEKLRLYKETILILSFFMAWMGVLISALLTKYLRAELYSARKGTWRRNFLGFLTGLVTVAVFAIAYYYTGSQCLRLAVSGPERGGLPADLAASVFSWIGRYWQNWLAALTIETLLVSVGSFTIVALLTRLLSRNVRLGRSHA